MNVGEVLRCDRIELSLSAKTKEEALDRLCDMLFESGAVNDKEAFLADVLKRESISTTGIGSGIAIPHGKSDSVIQTTAAIGRLESPVEWASVDDKPVEFIVLLAVSEEDKTGGHIKLLSEMARKLAKEENCKRLLSAKSKEEIIDIFSE